MAMQQVKDMARQRVGKSKQKGCFTIIDFYDSDYHCLLSIFIYRSLNIEVYYRFLRLKLTVDS